MAWLKRKDADAASTDRQLSEEEFQSLTRISAAVEALPLGVVIMSADGATMWSNAEVDTMFTPQSEDHVLFIEDRKSVV